MTTFAIAVGVAAVSTAVVAAVLIVVDLVREVRWQRRTDRDRATYQHGGASSRLRRDGTRDPAQGRTLLSPGRSHRGHRRRLHPHTPNPRKGGHPMPDDARDEHMMTREDQTRHVAGVCTRGADPVDGPPDPVNVIHINGDPLNESRLQAALDTERETSARLADTCNQLGEEVSELRRHATDLEQRLVKVNERRRAARDLADTAVRENTRLTAEIISIRGQLRDHRTRPLPDPAAATVDARVAELEARVMEHAAWIADVDDLTARVQALEAQAVDA